LIHYTTKKIVSKICVGTSPQSLQTASVPASTSSDLTTFHTIYGIYKSSFYMLKPPYLSFHVLFYDRCYPNSVSNVIISTPILSNLTTHPTQHPYLCYTSFYSRIGSLPSNTPSHTTSPVLRLWFTLQLEWYFCIT